LRLELKEAEEKSEQLQYDLTAAKDHIANVKCSLCKDHLEIFETIKKSLEETASSFPDVLQVEKAVTVLSASEKLTEELSANKVKLEEQLLSSKEELSRSQSSSSVKVRSSNMMR
jgi:NADH dehydrogenase/NADH:ubiquinone oxidoreductase subunit G